MKASTSSLNRELNKIIDVENHLSFVKSMVQKCYTSSKKKSELLEKVKLAEQRATDRTLRVAILGEFSSGKSTFINALLRQRLLKSARAATTATATHISYGHTLKVTVDFLDGRSIRSTALDTSQLCRAIAHIKATPIKTIPIREVIDILTSDQKVANFVKRVFVSLPNKNLKSGISIIDTPGIGAGASDTENHTQITQAVIEEAADAVIVLIPSAQPMSNTLISFLQSTTHRFLHRCIFIVTAMDNQEEEDRARILDFVNQCLRQKLELKAPVICESAAISALPIVGKVPRYKRTVWVLWQQQFAIVESTIFQELARQRNVIIAENLIHLFQSIFLDLETKIKERQSINGSMDELIQRKQKLESLKVKLLSI